MISESEVRQLVTQVVHRLAGPAAAPAASSRPSTPAGTPAVVTAAPGAKPRLVYQEEVRNLAAGAELQLPPGSRLTPLARELALQRRIKIVTATGPKAEAQASAKVIAIGADHGGLALKEVLKGAVAELGFKVVDVGTNSSDSVDYPDFAYSVAQLVAGGGAWRGIMVDGAGIGSAMVANKVPGVRASLCYDVSSASNAREHNDANVLTLGGQLIGPNLARQIVKTWLTTEFGGGRHARRVDKITAIEKRFLRA